ncbi:hypothetical protein F6X38_16580 [Aureimonas leprariae]|uniref:Apple domain-containing protein n=2 Tax=Plantimonas leprariae TaxID=2615207 RepID=A0A7V7PMH3_9HYPH|nr:hypothetical protein F6X38_16580 [Aureimonas leprariae]
MQCLSDKSCRAFTFNVKTPVGRGPNCFLKNSQGDLDGNSAAISGLLLTRTEADPQTMHFGAIDPNTNLYKDVDIPGFDLSRKPFASAKRQFDCRMACVKEGRCAAFTFVKPKKECWLKSGVGQPRVMTGAVSGAKTPMTFAPNTVSLN